MSDNTAKVTRSYDGRFWLAMPCPKYGRCPEIEVVRGPAQSQAGKRLLWGWDGNFDQPTIRPSVGCDQAPRCGAHRVITNGKF